ncbi:hypothetical protein P9209_13605 [Prescottella defluvii]|nr:hypothetical protein P9209_13605 [Prescottella defluvii]
MADRTARRRPAKKTARKAALTTALPAPEPGERVWMLGVPHRVSAPGATWNKKLRCHVYVGHELPAVLAPFAAKPYSYQQWLEDDFNGTRGPSATSAPRRPAGATSGGSRDRDRGTSRVARHGAVRRRGNGQDDLRGPRR